MHPLARIAATTPVVTTTTGATTSQESTTLEVATAQAALATITSRHLSTFRRWSRCPREAEPGCTSLGEVAAFTSRDGKATLRVFPTMTDCLRITVAPRHDRLAWPPLPGPPADLLVYDVTAIPCDGPPLAELPIEVNLTILHTADAYNVDESIIRFPWLDGTCQ